MNIKKKIKNSFDSIQIPSAEKLLPSAVQASVTAMPTLPKGGATVSLATKVTAAVLCTGIVTAGVAIGLDSSDTSSDESSYVSSVVIQDTTSDTTSSDPTAQLFKATRIWDMRHPDDKDDNPYFSVTVPELDNALIEHREDGLVYVKGERILGAPGEGCESFYLADINGDGKPELCFSIGVGSGMIHSEVIIYDYETRAVLFNLADRGNYDYYFCEENGVLFVEETQYGNKEVIGRSRVIFDGDKISLSPDINLDLRFSQYLDKLGMVHGVSQSSFINRFRQYKYDGNSIVDIATWCYYDGIDGGGSELQGEVFSLKNDYKQSEDNVVTYTNSFRALAPLEGLEMPYGISFGQSVNELLQKMGAEVDLNENFIKKTLYSDSSTSLQIIRRDQTYGGYNLEINYTSSYEALRSDGITSAVTRNLTLLFEEQGSSLCSLSANVIEEYRLPAPENQ